MMTDYQKRMMNKIGILKEEKGLTEEQIATKLGLHINTVMRYLEVYKGQRQEIGLGKENRNRQMGIKVREPIQKKTEFIQAVNLYKKGLTTKQISTHIRRSESTVKSYLRIAIQQGLINKIKGIRDRKKFGLIVQLYKEKNLTLQQIAEEVGTTRMTVIRYINIAKEQGIIQDKKKITRRKRVNQRNTLTIDEIVEIVKIKIKLGEYEAAINLLDKYAGKFTNEDKTKIQQVRESVKNAIVARNQDRQELR